MSNPLEDMARAIRVLERRVERLETQETTLRWVGWTPTVTQSGAVAATVTLARYATFGKLAIVEVYLAVTGAGTSGNAIVIAGQPTAIQAANAASGLSIGGFWVEDSGSAYYVGSLLAIGATDWRMMTNAVDNYLGANPSFALANNDKIRFFAVYERA